MTPVVVVDDATVEGIKMLLSRSLERGSHCTEPRMCEPCREVNKQALAVAGLVRSYQRKADRQRSSRKLSRLAIDVRDETAGLEDALRKRCLSPAVRSP